MQSAHATAVATSAIRPVELISMRRSVAVGAMVAMTQRGLHACAHNDTNKQLSGPPGTTDSCTTTTKANSSAYLPAHGELLEQSLLHANTKNLANGSGFPLHRTPRRRPEECPTRETRCNRDTGLGWTWQCSEPRRVQLAVRSNSGCTRTWPNFDLSNNGTSV